MSPHTYPTSTPIALPKLGSWPQSMHVFTEESDYALRAAEAAGRPLLIRGEPGTGKSQLARAAAVATGRLFLSVVVHARTESQDLQWHFDAVARLGEAQTLAHVAAPGSLDRLRPERFISPGPLWWIFDWHSAHKQWQTCAKPLEPVPTPPEGWTPGQGGVLLIDEIDKADSDLPNGLLETLGNGDFAIPYLITSVRQSESGQPPLVIMTTNEERELPDAFIRRCLVLSLSLPTGEQALLDFLCERGRVHFQGACGETVRRQAAELLLKDRQNAVDQGMVPPGQAEYLDLLRALSNMAQEEAEQVALLHKISPFMLKKSPAQQR